MIGSYLLGISTHQMFDSKSFRCVRYLYQSTWRACDFGSHQYVDRVNWLVMECHVIENASFIGGIYGKGVVKNGGESGAR